MSRELSSESLWAEHGLTGLVLFALFGLIMLFLKIIVKKDSIHQEFIQSLLSEERVERKEARSEMAANTSKLSMAIDELTHELRCRKVGTSGAVFADRGRTEREAQS
jgi:hypothetical protein